VCNSFTLLTNNKTDNEAQGFWRPWIQLHNIKEMKEIPNKGMTTWTDSLLASHVKLKQNGDRECAVNVMETRNFVATFVTELDLQHFCEL